MKIVQVLFYLLGKRVPFTQLADPVSDHAAANVFMTTFGEHSLLTSRRVRYRQVSDNSRVCVGWKNHGKATHIAIPISFSTIKSEMRIGSSLTFPKGGFKWRSSITPDLLN